MKVLQGFIDIAGQASRYANALKRQGIESESWVYERTIKSESYDRLLDLSKKGCYSGRLRKLYYLSQILSKFDILHIHKGFSLFHSYLDLKVAKHLGKKIFIHYRGSEIRKNMQAIELDDKVIDKVKLESEIAFKILVKDGQLAELISPYTNNFELFPNIVDVSAVDNIKKQYNYDRKLKIIHIPSNPVVKGTDIIRREVKKLSPNIEYHEYSSLNHKEVLIKYLEADIVIDQIYTGTYGNASLEAMALGTPVLNYLNPKYTAYEPEQPPIINIDPSNICDTIIMMDKNREHLQITGSLGKIFIDKYHTYEKVGNKLMQLYSRKI